jgi:hypothetical protein
MSRPNRPPVRTSALFEQLFQPLRPPREYESTGLTPAAPTTASYTISNAAPIFRPYGITHNPTFVGELLENFQVYCDNHPALGNDPDRLVGIQQAQADSPHIVIDNEADSIDFLTGVLLHPIARALRDLEGPFNGNLQRRNELRINTIRTRADIVWKDDNRTRAISQIKSRRVAHGQNGYFARMQRMAQRRWVFDYTQGRVLQHEESIAVKVSFDSESSVSLS